MNVEQFARDYIDQVRSLLNEVDLGQVEQATDLMLSVWREGGRVLLMGNGGSSSTASHMANDLQKNIFLETGRPLRALCLCDPTPLVMAWANDTNWDNVFAPQVQCWAQPGDLVIGISGSGNSMNVFNGVAAARTAGARTVGFAGFEGGKLKNAADVCLVVPSNNMQRIEDLHMILLHVVFSAVLERARAESKRT